MLIPESFERRLFDRDYSRGFYHCDVFSHSTELIVCLNELQQSSFVIYFSRLQHYFYLSLIRMDPYLSISIGFSIRNALGRVFFDFPTKSLTMFSFCGRFLSCALLDLATHYAKLPQIHERILSLKHFYKHLPYIAVYGIKATQTCLKPSRFLLQCLFPHLSAHDCDDLLDAMAYWSTIAAVQYIPLTHPSRYLI